MKTRHEQIWSVIRQVPRGRVATYGQISTEVLAQIPADQRGRCTARLVGYALHGLPPNSQVPWHRVINSQGRISFPPRSAPYQRQRKKLEAEGVVFMRGRVNLARYGWRARDESPLLD